MAMSYRLVFLFIGIFMLSFTSAAEFDNYIQDYDEDTETITFSNCAIDLYFGCAFDGSDIGTVQLKTPRDVKVAAGYNYVWEMDVWVEDDYNDFLKGFEFEDINKGREKINRDIDVKILSYEDVEVNDYGLSCGQIYNSTNGNTEEICESIVVGSHIESQEVWTKVTPANLKKADGKVTLRGYTNVQEGDVIDWSPLIFGVRVSHDIWATWTEDLNVNIIWYGKLYDNLATTNVIDSTETGNGTASENTNNLYTASGLINSAFAFDGTNYVDTGITPNINPSNTAYSISIWANVTDTGNPDIIWGTAVGSNQRFYLMSQGATDKWVFFSADNSVKMISTTNISYNNWVHLVLTLDGAGGSELFIDGVSEDTYAITSYTTTGNLFLASVGASGNLEGSLNEVGIWDRELNQSEITQLYNGGAGITYTDQTLIITLNQPANNTVQNNPTVDFNWTIEPSDMNITNWTLNVWYDNSTLAHQHINTTINTNETTTVIHNDTLFLDEDYIWNVESCGISGVDVFCEVSENWTFTLDTVPPVVNITYPIEGFIVTSPLQNITLNYTVEHPIGNLSNCFFNTSSNSTPINISCTANTTSFLYPVTNPVSLTIYVFGNDTASNLGEDNVTIYKDATAPQINVTSPIGTLVFGLIGGNETLNVTFTDATLDTCWYNYNGSNVTIAGCVSGVKNSTDFVLDVNNLNMTVYVNDSFGNLNSTFVEWSYELIEVNQTYSNETVEGVTETFSAYIISNVPVSTANLMYAGDSFIGTLNQVALNTYIINTSIAIPPVSVDTNNTFYWKVILSGGSQQNLTSHNQTVLDITIDNCAAGTTLIMNYSLLKEQSQNILNGTIEVDLKLLATDGTTIISTFSNEYVNQTNAEICINNVSTDNFNYLISSVVGYTATDFAEEFHNIQKASLDNSTIPINVSLYDLASSKSTTFVMSYKGLDFLPLVGALFNVQRNYLSEGVFKSVEIVESDEEGFAKAHFDTEGVIYRITITKDGEVIDSFDNAKVACANVITGDCQINLNSFSSATDFTDWKQFGGITFVSSFDSSTRTKTVSFNTIDGSPANITVSESTIDGSDTELCSSSLVSSAGVITCVVPLSFGNGTVLSTIATNDINILSELDVISSDPLDSFGVDAFVFAFIMVISFPLIMVGSPIGVMFGLLFEVFASFMLLLADSGGLLGPTAAFTWLLVAGAILIYKMMRRER